MRASSEARSASARAVARASSAAAVAARSATSRRGDGREVLEERDVGRRVHSCTSVSTTQKLPST